MFVVGASSDLGPHFHQRQKGLGLGWEESRLSHYDIRAEGALPPSVNVIVSVFTISSKGSFMCTIPQTG